LFFCAKVITAVNIVVSLPCTGIATGSLSTFCYWRKKVSFKYKLKKAKLKHYR
jgi:hypothetical protein